MPTLSQFLFIETIKMKILFLLGLINGELKEIILWIEINGYMETCLRCAGLDINF